MTIYKSLQYWHKYFNSAMPVFQCFDITTNKKQQQIVETQMLNMYSVYVGIYKL